MTEFTVNEGQVVSMEYTLHVDGKVLDSSEGQEPLEFLAGYGNIISGLEREMIGMKVGENKDVIIPPADGYGEVDEQAFMDVQRKRFPKDMPLKPGVEMELTDQKGHPSYARVESVEGETVRLNFNHPLAGKKLHFNVTVVGLREPTKEEIEHGHVHQPGQHQ